MSIIALALLVLMVLVIWLDATAFTIPNWLCGLVLALYPIMLFLPHEPVDWPMAIAAMSGMFVAGYVIFALGWMGGGDIKLLTACALWTGVAALWDFMIYTALLGGVLSIVLLAGRNGLEKLARFNPEKLPKIFRQKAPVPYGLAIAFAFVILLVQGKIPGLKVVF